MDPLLQPLTGEDHKMIEAYGDTLRGNDGRHLDGGIADDKFWQELHQQVIASVLPLYSPPLDPSKMDSY